MNEKNTIVEIWVYLSGSPLLALFITLAAYQLGLFVYQKSKQNPIANPVAITIILVASFIQIIGNAAVERAVRTVQQIAKPAHINRYGHLVQ